MKKYILSILAVAAVVGCTAFKDEASVPAVVPSDPTITVNEVSDDAVAFTITAAEGTGFYSYAIIAGVAQQLNATTLLKVGYKNSIDASTTDAAKAASIDVEVEGLDFNAAYTIYAVAASKQGTVGKIVTKEFTTSDTVNPAQASYTKKENVITLTFSEAVTYNQECIPTVKYYAVNNAVIKDGALVNDGYVGEGVAEVNASGKTVTVTVSLDDEKPLPAGAYYTVSYPEGTFVDALNNKCAAVSSRTGVTQAGALGFAGIYGRISTKEFALTSDEKKDIIVPSEQAFYYGIPEGVQFSQLTSKAAASILVESTSASKTSKTTYNLTKNYDWGCHSVDVPG